MIDIVTITPNKLKGTLRPPSSKSAGHRAIICAALSKEISIISGVDRSEDIDATIEAMTAFGAHIHFGTHGEFTIHHPAIMGDQITPDDPHQLITIDCKESGSTARFLMPFFHLVPSPVRYIGAAGLRARPFDLYRDLFLSQGISYEDENGRLPITLSGHLRPGHFIIKGNVSSQFISGLLFILPLLKEESVLTVIPPFESKDYVALTLEVLDAFGIKVIQKDPLTFSIPGNQSYRGHNATVEVDYSQAAFWLMANHLGADIRLEGLSPTSKQADRVITQFIDEMSRPNAGVERVFDVSQCPDLLPILATGLCLTPGRSRIKGGERVRIKESDRIHAIATELSKLGAHLNETPDGLIIEGVETLTGTEVEAWNDHRIAMALAIAAMRATGTVTLHGAGSVRKSYPKFWEDYQALGGTLNVK